MYQNLFNQLEQAAPASYNVSENQLLWPVVYKVVASNQEREATVRKIYLFWGQETRDSFAQTLFSQGYVAV